MGWISDIYKIAKDVFGKDDDENTEGGFGWNDALDVAKGTAPIISAGAGFFGQQATNAANAKQAATQMAFQERMSSTAYQRATADMQAAGLNPMLAYQQGGAASPAGASARFENAASTGVASAIQAATALAQVDNLKAQTAQTDAVTGRTRVETANEELKGTLMEAELPIKYRTSEEIFQRTNNLREENSAIRARVEALQRDNRIGNATESQQKELKRLQADLAHNETELQILQHQRGTFGLSRDEAESDFYRQTGTLEKYVHLGSEGIGAASSAARALALSRGRPSPLRKPPSRDRFYRDDHKDNPNSPNYKD